MKLYMVNLRSQTAMLNAIKNAKEKDSAKAFLNAAWNSLVQLFRSPDELKVHQVKPKSGNKY
ncbi:MAG: hypothetical protein SNJ57_05295 [Cyanobacteriota bacterium]